jgi:hypothetical protein
MVEFSDKPEVTEQPSGKKTVDFFASVRERGMLNASLDSLAQQYEDGHPGEGTRWEIYRPGETGGTDMVAFREGQGFKAVRQKDLVSDRPSDSIIPDDGIVRRGDLVLMAGPRELINEMRLQDAKAAHADLKAPQNAFEANVKANAVRTSSGASESAKPFGKVQQIVEDVPKVAAGEQD